MQSFVGWSRLRALFGLNIFDRFAAYALAAIGFIFGLRVRLIGEGDRLVSSIDGNFLIVSSIVLIVSVAIWKLTELIFYLRIPEEISEHPSVPKYMDQIKKGIFDEEHFKAIYDDKVEYWERLNNREAPKTRMVIVTGVLTCVFLYLLSISALLVSSWSFLHRLLALLVSQAPAA